MSSKKKDQYHRIHTKAKSILVVVLWILYVLHRVADGEELWAMGTLLGFITCAIWVFGVNMIAYCLEALHHVRHYHRKI